jgi:outer membrane protein assembly factor BamB
LVIVGDERGTGIAADARSGHIAWQRDVSASNVRGGLSSDGTHVYASFVEGTVACLTFDGKIVWKRAILERGTENTYPALTVTNKLVVVPYARDTYYDRPAVKALDKQTGKTVWNASDEGRKRELWGNVRSSPVVYGGLILYGEPYSNDLVALDLATGAYRWHLSMGAPMFPHWPSPAIAGDTLYLSRHDGGLYAVDLVRRKLKWMLYLGKAERTGPELPDDIMPKGWEHCAWDPAVGKALCASVAVDADGILFVGSGEGYLYCIAETPPSSLDGPPPMGGQNRE